MVKHLVKGDTAKFTSFACYVYGRWIFRQLWWHHSLLL